ncbi:MULTISPECIES: D-glycero-alpha-D-manno-heptose-1,7-bisphosphate 7-phosphatase [Flectobacillus]|jgi:D-glycero-D-manno-heptose 1,7-bisphosphate phosphatase|uniref:D,D-heptose 1,7-bisphosphate phosphatase n=2 Tax=Flectobacillus TaxID=101 RepID=A0ABT6YVE8_9BACT|nr:MULTISPECIES: HAD family hydrolase [Flectobacillus]NBA76712.1 HAD-IIIA family hydrolase [Emticicia sp. ODNR4P]MDI9860361.1 HAD family hydrolase [Flectobacillus roseus]MDI9867432.1 HAD family hydrolase [Flectobacillus longus]MDI9871813.1 HAD family hydrolase [Flectobacillus roseus]MDI9881606.1 HAD family hydrolase [Flectobacillus longus]
MNKCIFLDRDGVLNVDRVDYVYRIEDLIIPEGTVEALERLKAAGYLLIVITNQSGIAKGIYTRDDVWMCHNYFQEQCGHLLDDLYFCPHHENFNSASLTRKPGSLMIEKAIAKYKIDPDQSWMIGDAHRDIKAGHRAGVKTIHLTEKPEESFSEITTNTLLEASQIIVPA